MKKTILLALILILFGFNVYAGPPGGYSPGPTTINGTSCTPGGVCTITDATKLPLAGGTLTGDVTIGSTSAGKSTIINATRTPIHTFTSTNWNEDGATWTMAAAGPLVHITGNTTAVTATLTEAIVAGTKYRVSILGTGGGDSATYTLGGVTGSIIPATGAININDVIVASTNGSLIITPYNVCTASFTSIAVEKIISGTGDTTVYGHLNVANSIQDINGVNLVRFDSAGNASIGKNSNPSSTGQNNNALGTNTLTVNTSGANNTALGFSSLKYNTTGYENVGTGNTSLLKNTTGYTNTGLGYAALQSNTVGYENTAIGWSALSLNIDGYHNSAGGWKSMNNNTDGHNNTSFGAMTLYANTTGAGNTAVGYNTLTNNVTGWHNTALGENAGNLLLNGDPNLSSGDSVYIGFGSKSLAASSSNEVVLGADAVGHGSNTVTLGSNLITTTYLKGSVVTPSTTAGTGGGLASKIAEATSGALSGASGSIAINVPTGARIKGTQLRVDTAITSDNATKTWTAVYVNTPTTAICSGQAFAKDTVFNALHPAYEITTGTVTITITPAAGNFTAGAIRAVVYYDALVALSAAP